MEEEAGDTHNGQDEGHREEQLRGPRQSFHLLLHVMVVCTRSKTQIDPKNGQEPGGSGS